MLLDVAVFAQAANAQQSDDPEAATTDSVAPPVGVEMMKVKGRAVSGIETDVPESVTQFDAATIDALGAANIADLAKVTPNVEIRSAGSTTATFFIRGVGLADFSSNAAGAVGIFQDDVQLNAPAIQLGGLFDTETVDVKRGPQGHGLFRNSSAGAIRIFANKPSLDYEAKLKTSFGKFWTDDARDAFIREIEGAMNVPLIEDMLATRIAFRVRSTEPYIENGCAGAIPLDEREQFISQDPTQGSICGEQANPTQPIQFGKISHVPPGLKKYLGEKDDWAIRGALRFSPLESDSEILLNIHGSRLEQDSTVGETIGAKISPKPDGGSTSRFGDVSANGYRQPEQLEEFQDIATRRSGLTWDQLNSADILPGLTAEESAELRATTIAKSFEELGKNLAEDRVLDREPYRGDYNNPGRTTFDSVGGYLRGNFTIGDGINTQLTLGTEHYERFRDSDTDFSPAGA
ncbi:MAG: TonB-dependent receptor, partial [Myxococcota bacterium]|nr:TonB-dependent receptor [Myxococcota bacterium]